MLGVYGGLRSFWVLIVVAVIAPLLSACGATVTVPDVVGMRLDAAHREFESLEVDDFEDVDVIGEADAIFRDSNWVVVKQEPAAGTEGMDTDTTVKLEVGNEDDAEVLDLIPADSPFAAEVRQQEASSSAEEEPAAPEPSAEESEKVTPSPSPSLSPYDAAAVACARRKGNPGEIYSWNSYGDDQPPDAIRLGDGFVWNFGDKVCITSTEFALSTVAPLPGYCTEVGKVSANLGYPVDARPAPRLQNIIGQRGDC